MKLIRDFKVRSISEPETTDDAGTAEIDTDQVEPYTDDDEDREWDNGAPRSISNDFEVDKHEACEKQHYAPVMLSNIAVSFIKSDRPFLTYEIVTCL